MMEAVIESGHVRIYENTSIGAINNQCGQNYFWTATWILMEKQQMIKWLFMSPCLLMDQGWLLEQDIMMDGGTSILVMFVFMITNGSSWVQVGTDIDGE